MFKRSLAAIIMVFAIVMVLGACGSNNREFSRGSWSGNVYTNEYLGLRFEAPADWHVFSDARIALAQGISSDMFEIDNLADIDTLLTDMLVTCEETGTSVQVIFERLPLRSMTVEGYMEVGSQSLVEVGATVNILPGTTTIGRYEWHSLETEMDMGFGVAAYGRQFVNVSDGFARLITITYFEGGSAVVEDVLARFSEI
ncbi:MAG: hypothetical protein FWC69_01845 [Defluviitaleaceae bacterium]|nr:hypothetical protein [Defluviitaleaceae bacterium]